MIHSLARFDKVVNIILSCKNKEHFETCRRILDNYRNIETYIFYIERAERIYQKQKSQYLIN